MQDGLFMVGFLKILPLAPLLFLLSCRKENNNGYGSLLTNLLYDGHVVYPAKVYIKYGASPSPVNDPSNYDLERVDDPYGKAYFENLKPGDYFIFAAGYDGNMHTPVSGNATVHIGFRFRQNEEVVTIRLN